MDIDKYKKKLKKSKNYKNTLIYNLLIRNGNGIVDCLNYYYSNGITDLNQMIRLENNNLQKSVINKRTSYNQNIQKFNNKICVVFNSDFMICNHKNTKEHEFGIKHLVKILQDTGWKVYINKGKGDSLDYIKDVSLLIKYSDCNTPLTYKYFNNPNIDLIFGGVSTKWVDTYINKHIIYKHDFPKSCKIPSVRIDDLLNGEQYLSIKDYIEKNKDDIIYDHYIIKPLNTYSGNGIFYLPVNSSIDILNSKLNKKHFPYVIQPLIQNIARFNNKVNHIRTHILVSCFLLENNEYDIRISLYDKYFILLAKDDKTFDSHGKSTDRFRTFQDYYKKYDTILNYDIIEQENKEIVKVFKKLINSHFTNSFGEKEFIYSDRKSTFSLFAMDLMITAEGHLKLIEINYKVGTKFWVENQDEIKEFMTWIYNNGIKPMI